MMANLFTIEGFGNWLIYGLGPTVFLMTIIKMWRGGTVSLGKLREAARRERAAQAQAWLSNTALAIADIGVLLTQIIVGFGLILVSGMQVLAMPAAIALGLADDSTVIFAMFSVGLAIGGFVAVEAALKISALQRAIAEAKVRQPRDGGDAQ